MVKQDNESYLIFLPFFSLNIFNNSDNNINVANF